MTTADVPRRRLFKKTSDHPEHVFPWLGGSLLFHEGVEIEYPKLRLSVWEVSVSEGAPPAKLDFGPGREWWALAIERRRSRPRPFHLMQVVRDPEIDRIQRGLLRQLPTWQDERWAKAVDPHEGGPPLPWSSRHSWVYFIQIGEYGPIKIGIAEHPLARLAGLQTGHPYPLHLRSLMEGAEEEEAELHQRFAASRMEREWFEPTDDLLGFIAEIPSP